MKEKSLKKNFLYNFLYQILAIAVPLLTSPYLARVLGVENIGISSWTSSVVFYFGIFIMLGVENYGSREIAYVKTCKQELSKKFWEIYACQLINFFFVIIVYFAYIFFVEKNYKIVFLILVFSVISKGLDIAWFYSGMEEFKVTVTRNSIVKLLTLICVFVFVKEEGDLWKYVLINSFGTLLGQITLWTTMRKLTVFSRPKFCEIKTHYKSLWILFIPVLSISVFTYMDKYMIGKLSNVVQNGFYENADKIISVPKTFITTIGTVMLPRTAHLIATNREEESYHYIKLSMLYTMIMASALAFGIAAVSDFFSIVFWGEDFEPCGTLIMGLAPGIIFSVVGSVIRSQFLIPHARDKEYTISLIAGAITNFCVNLLLIPRFNALGAVIATLCSEIVLMSIQVFYVRKELPIKKYFQDGGIFFAFGLIMYFVVDLLKCHMSVSVASLITLIVIGAGTYCILSLVYIILSKNELIIHVKTEILKTISRRR